MKYELFKKAFNLTRYQKETIYNNFDNIINGFNEQERALNVSSRKTVLKTVLARGLHDPETPEEMFGLVDLLENFIRIDDNISHENISIFLKPMSHSSQKIMLRPCKIIGLIKNLDRLSRQYKKDKDNKILDLNPTIKEFNENLNKIKLKVTKPKNPAKELSYSFKAKK